MNEPPLQSLGLFCCSILFPGEGAEGEGGHGQALRRARPHQVPDPRRRGLALGLNSPLHEQHEHCKPLGRGRMLSSGFSLVRKADKRTRQSLGKHCPSALDLALMEWHPHPRHTPQVLLPEPGLLGPNPPLTSACCWGPQSLGAPGPPVQCHASGAFAHTDTFLCLGSRDRCWQAPLTQSSAMQPWLCLTSALAPLAYFQ